LTAGLFLQPLHTAQAENEPLQRQLVCDGQLSRGSESLGRGRMSVIIDGTDSAAICEGFPWFERVEFPLDSEYHQFYHAQPGFTFRLDRTDGALVYSVEGLRLDGRCMTAWRMYK